jgi:hypothetical protein
VKDFAAIVDNWLPISFAMNNINRCMGQPDLYPFVLSPAVIDKLSFVHRLVGSSSAASPRAADPPRPLKKAL